MATIGQNGFSNKEKVTILLAEYATLRTEILTRTGNMYQLFAIGGGLFVFVAKEPSVYFWATLFSIFLVVLSLHWFIDRDIRKAARRLRQIEQKINNLANEELLVWETQWGGDVAGYWGKSNPLQRKNNP